MKSILIILLFLPNILWAQANSTLTVEDMQSSKAFMFVSVTEVEKVFSDDLTQEDFYKVTFTVDTDECAASGEIDYCEQSAPLCEYAIVDTSYETLSSEDIYTTGVSCDKDLEEVLDPMLFDEL